MVGTWTGKDMEGGSHDLNSGTITAFAWKDWEKHEQQQSSWHTSWDLNLALTNYKAEVLLDEPTFLVKKFK